MAPTRYVDVVTGPGKGLGRALTALSCPADLQGSLEEVRGQEGDRHPDIGGKAALSSALAVPSISRSPATPGPVLTPWLPSLSDGLHRNRCRCCYGL